jgi:glyoxylase-like metal-dependent hydrolase (beta-lactamase superfamily II)
MSQNRTNQGRGASKTAPPPHSRAMEQRVEVIPDQVYIHSIPLLMDNIAYLIVFVPLSSSSKSSSKSKTPKLPPLQAYVVDCSDAAAVTTALEQISNAHYQGMGEIVITAILSTHKHHDHTAGNKGMLLKHSHNKLNHDKTLSHNRLAIYGGAVERVPHCTDYVRDGDEVPVPDYVGLQDLVAIEVIAVPSHTRGSVVFALRTKATKSASVTKATKSASVTKPSLHLFTGDAMFSGGGGVPFEADTEYRNPNKVLRPGAGNKSVERCFAEVLVRAGGGGGWLENDGPSSSSSCCAYVENALVFPGHDYTAILMGRQLDPRQELGKFWNQMPPSVFFEAASHYLVSSHRRSLPRGTKLLTVPSPLTKEFKVNPHFRSLIRRGEKLVQAVLTWRQYYKEDTDAFRRSVEKGAKKNNKGNNNGMSPSQMNIVIQDSSMDGDNNTRNRDCDETYARTSTSLSLESAGSSTNCSAKSWTLTPNDIKRNVFTTVYTADLDDIIRELTTPAVALLTNETGTAISNSINSKSKKKKQPLNNKETALKLVHMKQRLEKTVVARRPVPNSLPSAEQMFQGAMAMAILGAPPSAMTPSDGDRMNLPKPVNNADYLLVSKSRILHVLFCLGLIPDTHHCVEAHAFGLLWEVAQCGEDQEQTQSPSASTMERGRSTIHHQNGLSDVLDLGLLKYTLYGAVTTQAQRKSSFWSCLCRPCTSPPTPSSIISSSTGRPMPALPPSSKKRRRTGAELVRHDMQACLMCKDVVGCPHLGHDHARENIPEWTRRSFSQMIGDELEECDELEEEDVSCEVQHEPAAVQLSPIRPSSHSAGQGQGVEMEAFGWPSSNPGTP